MAINKLKPCSCGETPTELHIQDNGQGGKWATASGDCCDEWMIEFRASYFPLDADECMALAIASWDEAPRANDKETKCEHGKGMTDYCKECGRVHNG